ncbi:MAG: hypothetical protein J6I73_07245 [Treponema sp.]|nr:hypothetical protein [Treponema sp.]
MKKLLLMIFLLLPTASFAGISFFTPEMTHTVSSTLFLDTSTGFTPYPDATHVLIPSGALSYSFEVPEFLGETGARFSAKTVDFVTRTVYWPKLGNYFNAGVGATYHFLAYKDAFFEQDVLAGVFVKFTFGAFTVSNDFNYFFKWTNVYASSMPHIKNHSIALSGTWSWFVLNHLDFYFSFSSYELWHYSLFFSPNFTTGFDWRFDFGLILGMEFTMQFFDFMAVSAYFDHAEIRVLAKWEFK